MKEKITPEFLTMVTLGNFPWPRECLRPTRYDLHLANTSDPERIGWDLQITNETIGTARAACSILLDRVLAQAIVIYVELATKEIPGGQVRIPMPAALSMVRAVLDKVVEVKENEQ